MIKAFFGALLSILKKNNEQSFIMLEKRGCDDFGCGHYGASRGNRIHEGEDFKYNPGEPVRAFRSGKVNKIGYPYEDDLSYRYPQISDGTAYMRYFYCQPIVNVGDYVEKGQIIGYAQNISKRYDTPTKKMTNHVHFETLVNGKAVDPEPYYT